MLHRKRAVNKNRRGYEGYKRRPEDGRDDVLCEPCGVTVKARGLTLHKQGVFHRQSKRIRALLKKPCITQIEIAERLRVTTQRVQQIASRMLQIDGSARRRVCTLKRADCGERIEPEEVTEVGLCRACEEKAEESAEAESEAA